MKLGSSTDTEDAHGSMVEEKEVLEFPSETVIDKTLNDFLGDIIQIPPMYSAVKVNGKKLYEYARANEAVERPKREVTIYELEKLSINPKAHTVRFKVVCSKGTYIRTLCVDIGAKLGYPAHMSALVRTETGTFSEKNAVSFAMIEEAVEQNEQQSLLHPIMDGITHLDRLYVNEDTKRKILNGQKLAEPKNIELKDPFAVLHHNELLAIYQHHPDKAEQIKPVRVFSERS